MIFNLNSQYGKKMAIYKNALDASLLRRSVIANNIANADTPFFKRSEVTFESQLKRAIDSEKKPEFPALMKNDRHMSFSDIIDYKEVSPHVVRDFDTSYRNDKNNVDIEKEMADSNKNSMRYNAMIDMYSRNLKTLDIAMR